MKSDRQVRLPINPSSFLILNMIYEFAAKQNDEEFKRIFDTKEERIEIRKALQDFFTTYIKLKKAQKKAFQTNISGNLDFRAIISLSKIASCFFEELKKNKNYHQDHLGEEGYKKIMKHYEQFFEFVSKVKKFLEEGK